MHKIGVYVPESHLEIVKNAMFAAGAGRYEQYDSCCWQVEGTGQFRPAETANPYTGTPGNLETTGEYRLEMVCEDAFVRKAIEALLSAHPYEVPAYDIVEIKTYKDF
jgi:hypothetical protein